MWWAGLLVLFILNKQTQVINSDDVLKDKYFLMKERQEMYTYPCDWHKGYACFCGIFWRVFTCWE